MEGIIAVGLEDVNCKSLCPNTFHLMDKMGILN